MFAAHNMMLAGAKKSAVTFSALTSSSSNTVTLPTHAVGNIIIIVATSSVQDPTVPTASGTVPTWVNIQNGAATPDGFDIVYFRVYYGIATATNHTSGNWALGGGGTMASAVFTGNKTSSPIGGKTKAGDNFPSSTATVTAPSITLTDTSGRSAIVQNWFRASASFAASSFPSGYTSRFAGASQAFSTKDVTTSDGTADVTMDTSTTNPWAAVQFEILAS